MRLNRSVGCRGIEYLKERGLCARAMNAANIAAMYLAIQTALFAKGYQRREESMFWQADADKGNERSRTW